MIEEKELIRLQKYLSNAGVASRRKCEELILSGKVRVNGKTVTELGTKVDPDKDVVIFDGKEITNSEDKKHTYILLNKPIDYVTTVKDQFGRNTVLDLIVEENHVGSVKEKMQTRLIPVRKVRYVYIGSTHFDR